MEKIPWKYLKFECILTHKKATRAVTTIEIITEIEMGVLVCVCVCLSKKDRERERVRVRLGVFVLVFVHNFLHIYWHDMMYVMKSNPCESHTVWMDNVCTIGCICFFTWLNVRLQTFNDRLIGWTWHIYLRFDAIHNPNSSNSCDDSVVVALVACILEGFVHACECVQSVHPTVHGMDIFERAQKG